MGDVSNERDGYTQSPREGLEPPDIWRFAPAGYDQMGGQAFIENVHGLQQYWHSLTGDHPPDEQHREHLRESV
ncbi:hypothetical protein D3C87_2007100 [compost metagenome]